MVIATRSRNEWIVPSASDTDALHIVKRVNGQLSCSCDGCYYRGTCRHIIAVAATLPTPASKGPSAADTAALFMAPRHR